MINLTKKHIIVFIILSIILVLVAIVFIYMKTNNTTDDNIDNDTMGDNMDNDGIIDRFSDEHPAKGPPYVTYTDTGDKNNENENKFPMNDANRSKTKTFIHETHLKQGLHPKSHTKKIKKMIEHYKNVKKPKKKTKIKNKNKKPHKRLSETPKNFPSQTPPILPINESTKHLKPVDLSENDLKKKVNSSINKMGNIKKLGML